MPPPEPSTFPFTFPFKDIQTKIPKTPLPRNLFGKEMYSYPSFLISCNTPSLLFPENSLL